MASLIKNTTFYTLGLLLPKIGAFVFLPIYLKYLTTTDYGIVSSLHVFGAILAVVFTLSMPRALYRIYYDYKTINEKKVLFGTVFISVFVLSIVSLIILFLMKYQVQKIYHSIDFYPYFAYAILVAFFQVFHGIPAIFLQIKERASTFVIISTTLFFIKSALILWFIIVMDRGARGYLEAEMIAALLFIPVYYYFIRNEIVLKWNKQMFRNVIIFSFPIIPGILSAWILNMSDRVFIERYFSISAVGIYSLGYQIAGIVLIFSGAFKKAYDPYFYKIANTEKMELAKMKLYKTNYIFVLILLLLSFILSLFAKEGIILFFGEAYYPTIQVIPIISLAYLVSQNSALLNTMMYQQKKTIVVMLVTLVAAILNIILNFVLIPNYGILGAAYATLFSFILVFILKYILAKKAFFIPYNWKGILLVFSLLLFIYFGFQYIDIQNIFLSIIIKLSVILLLGIFVFIKHKESILQIIKVKK